MQIRPFQLSDEAEVIALWRQCELVRPVNDPARDIRRKMAVNPELFLVGTLERLKKSYSHFGARIFGLWRGFGEGAGLRNPVTEPKRSQSPKRPLSYPSLPNGYNIFENALNGEIIAAAMVGYEGHRGWVNYLAVHPNHRLNGYGRQMMAEAEKRLRAVGCPKINLQVRTNNRAVIEFYRRIGFAMEDVVSLGKRLEHDEQKL